MPESDNEPVIPAQLSYLAIYNPTLGPTDETLEDQIVFYTSRSGYLQRTEGSGNEEEGANPPENGKNERLRQIGLAQGMVNFAGNFSSQSLEYVETEKSRIVLLELEKDWWVVADVDLTRLPADMTQQSPNDKSSGQKYQYSSREMGHPLLTIRQLRRAHSIFLLHHDYSLDDLYTRVGRSVFCLYMERFWEKFAWNWELLMTGNPIVEIYNGIKLSAGGELGVGVGEEEWGSGEREVLEDFVARTDGLQDLVVSRFGEPQGHTVESSIASDPNNGATWLGLDAEPRPADGVVFSGVHAISRKSVARISHWMEWIYRYGDATYGIRRDPNSLRRRKPQRHRGRHLSRAVKSPGRQETPAAENELPGIPRPLVTAVPQAPAEVSERSSTASPASSSQRTEASAFGTEAVMKVLTLGYGSAWSLPNRITSPLSKESSTPQSEATAQANEARPETKHRSMGRFIIGPRDDLEALDDFEEEDSIMPEMVGNTKTRIVHRPLHLHLRDEETMDNQQKLHAVIYVHQPFVFTFLFDPEKAPLSSPSLYSTIHHQLGPLQKPLVSSTSPMTAASRIGISDNSSDPTKRLASRNQEVYDLVWDPSNLTIRTSIPNIPGLGSPAQTHETTHSPRTSSPSPSRPPTQWSRVESLAIHHHLLTTHIDTRYRPQEIERTCKTSRGWWVLWVRMRACSSNSSTPGVPSTRSSSVALSTAAEDQGPPVSPQLDTHAEPQEAFIIRKASDYVAQGGHARISSGVRFFRDLGGASSTNTMSSRAENTPSKLVEGLGIDARRYVEGLLRLNR